MESPVLELIRSPNDRHHVALLSTRYSSRCRIDAPEDRAITFDQLTEVLNYAVSACDRWQDLSTSEIQPLTSHGLDHYDVVNWILRPVSEANSGSFVEMVATCPQEPEYYLSHYFGQPVGDILQCVRHHLRTRHFSDDTPYWAWAYAHRYGQDDVLPDRIYSSPAWLAMSKSRGILLALGNSSVPLSRTWCLLEITLAMERRQAMDIAACSPEGVKLLTEHLTEVERKTEHQNPGAGFKQKSQREQTFPAEILLAALDIGLERSDASSKLDRNRILYKLLEERGVEIGSVPLHRLLEKVNVKLRALFASMLWFPVLETESGKLQRTRTALADCIRAHAARDCIELSFCASRIDDAHMAALARSMHKNLATVDLNFCMCPHVTAKGMEDVAKCLPAKLRTLRLNFKLCSGIGQGGVDALSNSLPAGLTSLHLNLACNSEIRSLASLCRGIRSVQSLKFLDLDLSVVEYLSDKSLLALAEMLNDLCSLKHLLLSLKGCKSITDAGVVAIQEGLPRVTLLKLDFAFCNISDESIESLANRMKSMPDLCVMHISFHGCQNISEASVGHLVQVLPSSLKGAKLNLCDTPLPMTIQKHCRRLVTMRAWMPFKLSAAGKESPGPGSQDVPASAASDGTDKPGLTLRSLDLFVRRGFVQEARPAKGPRPPEAKALKATAGGLRDLWQRASEEEERRLRRTFSEPYKRPLKALLPKVVHRAKGSNIASMAHPECMFSRPRTTHGGFSEPVWCP
ncbi:FBL4 [Symbiodinium sp. CCMP2592]|nr:FBL4 [Symbiodinium sp. CCMP2592]